MVLKVYFGFKKCAHHEKECSNFFFFFGGHFLWSFFGQIWGNLDRILLHPEKFACSYTSVSDYVHNGPC